MVGGRQHDECRQDTGMTTAVVVIGRNEGEYLKRCLESVLGQCDNVVYVDSGSRDHSLAIARSLDVHTLSLDRSMPFTAARARNVGFDYLNALDTAIKYIHFVDGDCEMIEGSVNRASALLETHQDTGIVFGCLHERNPNGSIYNHLCDIEWKSPMGMVDSCGGIFLVRTKVFCESGGFVDALVAGEEPELCLRIRHAGWKVLHADYEMAYHDANITGFAQWWRRACRSGYAYAATASLHRGGASQFHIREVISIWLWGAAVPLSIVLSLLWSDYIAAIMLLIYPIQVIRMSVRVNSMIYAFFCVLIKFPQLLGQIHWILDMFKYNRGARCE